ncbi:unnamed protein product [Timema podura]|uniref:Uncharacterized protein n=1 Tax=Timema podura TaxID=61482 RepID=A0ABN7P6Y2_TIMPD|nr:unnamed protein product [Timema podura]
MSLAGKVALVTGAATGIGLKYVNALLANGVKNVSIVDLDESNGIKAAKELNAKFGEGRTLFIKANITDKGQFEAAFEKTVDAFKGLDIVTNNAGIMQDKRWEEEIELNFVSRTMFHCDW